MEQSSSCPHPLRENDATANCKGSSTFVHLSVESPMAREVMRKDCRSHMVGKAQHCTAAKTLYQPGILGPWIYAHWIYHTEACTASDAQSLGPIRASA